MKKIVALYIISTVFMLNVSFIAPTNNWGAWTVVSSSYVGIEARVKKGDFNEYAGKYHWEIQFRNRYDNTVHFNYDCSAMNESYGCNPNKRKNLEAGESSDVTAFLINDSYKIHVCIGDVKFDSRN